MLVVENRLMLFSVLNTNAPVDPFWGGGSGESLSLSMKQALGELTPAHYNVSIKYRASSWLVEPDNAIFARGEFLLQIRRLYHFSRSFLGCIAIFAEPDI